MLHSQSGVCGCIVVMEHPVVRAPFAWPLPPHVLPKPSLSYGRQSPIARHLDNTAIQDTDSFISDQLPAVF
jgi:hypothetical protein